MMVLGEYIFCIGLRRFVTPPNMEYIFSQLHYKVVMSQNRKALRLFVFSHKGDVDRDNRLNSILKRHCNFIMTVLGENIFCFGLHRFVSLPNMEYNFSQLHYKVIMLSQNRI